MKIYKILLLFFALFLFNITNATNWYIDNVATGSNIGTSWINAWINPTNVVWANVNPGDTIFVSGGSTTKIYTDSLAIGKDGTVGNPITVKIGQEAGHNGVAIFTNACVVPNGTRPKWNVIDGGRNPAFVPPTNHQQVATGPTCITNNIGFWFRDAYGTNNSDTSPAYMYLRKPDNCTFRWIAMTTMTNTGTYAFAETRGTAVYIDQGDETQPATNTVFEYIYLFGNMGQQFAGGAGPNSGAAFDEMVFRFLWLDQNGEDHFELGGGVTVRDSVIGPCYPNGVHNDFFQFTGNRVKIYNNDIRESQNSIMRIQSSPAGSGTNLRHSVWFYNNLVTEKQGRALGGGTLVEPFCMVHFDSQSPTHMTIWSNIVFANNLIYNSVLSTAVEPDEMSRNQVMYWSRGNQVTNSIITSNLFVNNLVVMKHKGISFPASTNVGAAGNYWTHTTNDMWVDYNVFAGTNRDIGTISNLLNPRLVSYMDLSTNIEFHPFKFNNTTNWPTWIDVANDNFELTPSDTSAKDQGYNMSSYFTTDALNRPRNINGAWDRGPLELQETNLILWLRFEDDFSDSRLDDSSSQGNHAYRYGRPSSIYPTNFPTQVSATNTIGTNGIGGGYCGDFIWWTNSDYGLYLRDGQYAAITNIIAFTNLTQATITIWARYDNVDRINNSYDYSVDGNSALISAGTSSGILGSWDLGRFNQAIWINNTRFYVTTNSNFNVTQTGNGSDLVFGKAGKAVFNFPDNGFSNGDTAKWHHYVITFNNGIVKTYYDGTNLVTCDLSSTINHLTVGLNNSVSFSTGFIGIGCDTHGGTPSLENETGEDYPNNGWFNGQMDDVRIYNRVLSPAEIDILAHIGTQTQQFNESPVKTMLKKGIRILRNVFRVHGLIITR